MFSALATMPLWAQLLVGLVPAIAAGISGFASYNASKNTNKTNVQLTNQNNALQMQLAGQANQWSLDQWNRENAYNNPISQRMRLESAGINPALIYGNGGLVNEAASSPAVTMANTKAAQVATPTIPDPLTAAQVANLNAQTESIQHETEREDTFLASRIKQVDAMSKQVDIYEKDILNQIKMRGREFELKKYVQHVELDLKQKEVDIKQGDLNVSEQNMLLQVALFPFMAAEHLELAGKYAAEAAKATTEQGILEANKKLADLYQQVYDEFETDIKTGKQEEILANIAKNAADKQEDILRRKLASNPFLYYTYKLLGILAGAGSKLGSAAILAD